MNCNEARRHWELYYDSEGDSELYLKINEHLAECPSCAKWFFQQGHFEELVTAKLSAGEPTAALWDRVRCNTGLTRPVSARGWMFFGSFMAIAACLLLVVGAWWLNSGQKSEHLAALTAVVHRGFAEQNQPIEFSSPSDLEIEQYLKSRVSFPVRCPPRQDAGFAVRGGGICNIAGDSAAYVIGEVENQSVSIFVLPAERLREFAHERDVLSREAVHHCQEGGYDMVLAKIDRNIVVVIGKGSPEKLERVVRAYGTYPEMPKSDAA
jgi:anti-sigma factor RsiW